MDHITLKSKMPVYRVTTPRKTLLIAAESIEDIPEAVRGHGSDVAEISSITKTDMFLDMVVIPESALIEPATPNEAAKVGEAKP